MNFIKVLAWKIVPVCFLVFYSLFYLHFKITIKFTLCYTILWVLANAQSLVSISKNMRQNNSITTKNVLVLPFWSHPLHPLISPKNLDLISVPTVLFLSPRTSPQWNYTACSFPTEVHLRCARVAADKNSSFFFVAKQCSMSCIQHIMFVYSAEGHLHCFHILVTMNKADIQVLV